MMQVIKMTDEEKFKMYMEVPHEELVRMKIEEERLMEIMENERPQYYSTQPHFTLTAEEVEIVEYLAEWGRTALKAGIGFGFMPSIDEIKRLEKIDNLLTRIKQWQDENNRTD